VNYLPPFAIIRNVLMVSKSARGKAASELDKEFRAALRLLLAGISVDEDWYLAQNPDIAQAIEAGTTASAKQHFVDHGYFEGRLPFRILVDETWYLLQNPDVAENVRNGIVESGQRHFELDGYHEGRLPFALDASRPSSEADREIRLVAA
jgi:hypothetical protein